MTRRIVGRAGGVWIFANGILACRNQPKGQSFQTFHEEQVMRAITLVALCFAMFASTKCQSETAPWRAFAAKNKVMRWVGRESLVANPYKYKDQVIAFQAWFVGSISETAIFSDRSKNLNQAISVHNMLPKSLKKGEPVVVAVQVAGPDPSQEFENLSLVEIYHCRKEACSEFAKFNDSGGLMIVDAPVRPLVQRASEQAAGAMESQEDKH
jgi:hypothetical protein